VHGQDIHELESKTSNLQRKFGQVRDEPRWKMEEPNRNLGNDRFESEATERSDLSFDARGMKLIGPQVVINFILAAGEHLFLV